VLVVWTIDTGRGGGGGEIEASWESVRDNPKAMKKFCGGR